ncbi:hypothetical protein GCM10023168_06000 [Fodinibacter luteus]|uniref:Uncharacterized protein n=1 Tax=Fodinibacter luteus TaxID=552064 RepID=A0ABP8K180_9MICO
MGAALRLGWAVAEVRGRAWPDGPRPGRAVPPLDPPDVLPLRSQRRPSDAHREALRGLLTGVERLRLDRHHRFADELAAVLPVDGAGPGSREAPASGPGDTTAPGDASASAPGDAPASAPGDAPDAGPPPWAATAGFFLSWDAWFQDELAQRDEALANAYLLGRGLAECYWGLGSEAAWSTASGPSAVSPAFLLGADRRRELSRMLGRLDPAMTHETTPAAISGSLEAWGAVAEDEHWHRAPDLRVTLYEQVRRWYQLIILGQDPTTLIRPYAKLTGVRGIGRAARLFWPQAVLFITAFALVTGFFTVSGGSAPTWVTSLLATSGFGVFVAAGLLARGQSAAQRLLTRLRQDAYTDLVAVSLTTVPERPPGADGRGGDARSARSRLESLVRRRALTPPTPPPA